MMKKNRNVWLVVFLGLLAVGLLYWALKDVSFSDIVELISQLSPFQIFILLLVNTVIMLLFGLRWWLILREMGYKIPYMKIASYRLAAFGVSYFTPGPQFGGEPLQIYFLRKKHSVPGSTAAASVALDKLIEVIANFSFLLIASGIVLRSQMSLDWNLSNGIYLAVTLLITSLIYLATLYFGISPVSLLFRNIAPGFLASIESAESELIDLVQNKTSLLLQSLLVSAIVWLALVFEYDLALSFLGLDLPTVSVIAIMFLARLAMLVPTPGALGALEASLVFSMTALALNPAAGISLGLLIRARDILFGGLGLYFGLKARKNE